MENNNIKKVDALIVGAGFAGIYLTYRLQNRGLKTITIEAGEDVGGTWYWNRYPGARCDIQSIEYSFSFSKEVQDEWNWTEKFAPQPELLRYARFVADKYDLKEHMKFKTKVIDATFDEGTGIWKITTDSGDKYEAKYFILATGCLSVPRVPNFKGMGDFKGEFYHTGNWPHNPVNFEGKKVAVIGTGSSGIQSIPVIAETAKEVTVFIKDSNYTIPANNRKISPDYINEARDVYEDLRNKERYSQGGYVLNDPQLSVKDIVEKSVEQRLLNEYSQEEISKLMDENFLYSGLGLSTVFADLMYDEAADEKMRNYLDERIRKIVKDSDMVKSLIPQSGRFMDRRPVLDTHYYETYNKEHVNIIDVNSTPIEEFYENGIRTSAGEEEFDMIVCATGFDAMTGAINRINIIGKGGYKLSDKWSEGPKTYLGLMTNGFPNLFMVTGPGSPSVLSNMLVSIEQHVEWIDDCLIHLNQNGYNTIEAEESAEKNWVDYNIEIARPLFFTQGNSWYVGANVPGKPRVIMPYVGGVGEYRKKCEEIVKNGYTGFVLSSNGKAVETVA